MTPYMHAFSVGVFAPTLGTLSNLLDKGLEHTVIQRLDATHLPEARLAPDMYPLTQQVQIACDHAKNGSARLIGATPPVFEDVETTLEDLKTRITRTLQYLETLDPAAFEGADTRPIKLPLGAGLEFEANGLQFLRDWALPHFYFHYVTAYDILRHEGLEIGKRDYLAHVGYAVRETA